MNSLVHSTKTKNDTYLGFDFGIKKIGIAIGHGETKSSSPLETITSINQRPNWGKIGLLINQWQPCGLIVGLSKQQDGSDNPITLRMNKFSRQLEGRFQLPTYQIDETLTTFEAKQLLYDDIKTNATKLWAVQDQLAAQLILQTWLNHHALNNHE